MVLGGHQDYLAEPSPAGGGGGEGERGHGACGTPSPRRGDAVILSSFLDALLHVKNKAPNKPIKG